MDFRIYKSKNKPNEWGIIMINLKKEPLQNERANSILRIEKCIEVSVYDFSDIIGRKIFIVEISFFSKKEIILF